MAVPLQQLTPANAMYLLSGRPTLATYDWLAGISCVSAVFALIALHSIPTVDNIDPDRVAIASEEEKSNRQWLYRITYGCLAAAIVSSGISFVTTYRLGFTKIN